MAAQGASVRNVYACLVHERFDCVVDLVRNLRYFDPVSPILLYNGGADPGLLNVSFPFDRYGAIVHPVPRPAHWGRLHGFALDCMAFALAHAPFDTLTIVDSDQLAIRADYTSRLAACLRGRPRAGLLGNTSRVQAAGAPAPAAVAAFREIDLWRPFLRRFRDGEAQFVRWCFWPSTVFTADAARELTALFAHDVQLREIMDRTEIWATEEVVLPTLVGLAGLDVLTSPCSYAFVTYRTPYSAADGARALEDADAFWIHPVPRRYDDPLRAFLRERHDGYRRGGAPPGPRTTDTAPLARPLPLPSAMRQAEGWLEEDEAELLLAAAVRALGANAAGNLVEIGSYCGRSTIVLGHAARAAQGEARVFAVDPHEGQVGALDRGLANVGPTFARFRRNIADAGLADVVEPIRLHSAEVPWDRPIALLFIDGLHDYVNVACDFHHFAPWLEPDGCVAFHDYADYYPGVRTFVDELLDAGDFEIVELVRGLIVVRRRSAAGARPPASDHAARAVPSPDPESTVVTTSGPLVSCIMPTADRAEFVPQAIAYFLRQDYPARELIVIDDGVESVASLVPPHPLIRYVRSETRQTMGAKHNLACELARGEIICHWDDDDWNADWRVSYQVQELLRCPVMTLSGLSRVLHYEPATGTAVQYIYPADERPWVGGNTLCYRKEFWLRHRFPNMNEGADSVFVWSLADGCVRPLTDHTFFVAIIHARNTSPKRTQGFGWHPCHAQDVRALLKDDCRFYDRWRT